MGLPLLNVIVIVVKLVPSLKVLAAINLILGLFLWFLFSTDYSLIGNISDILFPPVTGIIALVLLAIIKISNKRFRLSITLAHLPSIIGGGLYIMVALVMFVPPFTLAMLFNVSEIASETEIQRVISPDGTRVAYVYFRGVGAYSGGNGRIFIRVRHSKLPFLERDIFYLSKSYASEESTNYLDWRDSDTIYISEIEREISVGIIEAEIPPIFDIPYSIIRSIPAMAEQAIRYQPQTKSRWDIPIFQAIAITEQVIVNYQQTAPVRDLPIYPGNIRLNQSHYREIDNNVERYFKIEQEGVGKVEKWYEEVLAKLPWKLVKVNRYTETYPGVFNVLYCVEATRDIGNEQRVYYWEFFGSNDLSRDVHVRIGTPNPISDTCRRYVESP